jgi:hypothetical protein
MNLYNLVAADGPSAVAQATAPLKDNFRQLVTTLGKLMAHVALSQLCHKPDACVLHRYAISIALRPILGAARFRSLLRCVRTASRHCFGKVVITPAAACKGASLRT